MTLPADDKSRKALPIFTWLTEYFPDAILELVKVSVAGNEQHNPGEPLHWARGKSMQQMDTAFRHMWDHKRGQVMDVDGQYHMAKAAWRCLAELQLTIERERAADAASLTETFGPIEQPAMSVYRKTDNVHYEPV
jgi:hypothetical protein